MNRSPYAFPSRLWFSINKRPPRDWRELFARRPRVGDKVRDVWSAARGSSDGVFTVIGVEWGPSGGLRYKALHVNCVRDTDESDLEYSFYLEELHWDFQNGWWKT